MKIAVVAPHPDDETLGCGGVMLRYVAEGHEVHWVVVSVMRPELGFTEEQMTSRQSEIKEVSESYGVTSLNVLDFPTTRLDAVPTGDLVAKIKEAIDLIRPEHIYVPWRNDIHSDHTCVFDATLAASKWFRLPGIRKILAYETLSETEAQLSCEPSFDPNVFIDISPYLDRKVEIMRIYKSEMGEFPFPRSEKAIRALAQYRGVASGFNAAEAFVLLREFV